jgi:hypothetical protein
MGIWMEAEFIRSGTETLHDDHVIGLRAVNAPLSTSITTWVMDVQQEDLPLPSPPCKRMGFWNDIPREEQREVVELMPPTYGRGKRYVSAEPMSFDVREMALLFIGLYLLMALSHLLLIILHW